MDGERTTRRGEPATVPHRTRAAPPAFASHAPPTIRNERSRSLRTQVAAAPVRADALGLAVLATTVAVGAIVTPLGLDRVTGAGPVTASWSLKMTDGAGSPLSVLWAHLFSWLPVGEAPLRVNLASSVASAVAAFLAYRLCRQVLADARPPLPVPRPGAHQWVHEVPAALGGVAVGFFALGAFSASHLAGPAGVTAALVMLGLNQALSVARDPSHAASGLALAFACGLALGGAPLGFGLLAPPGAVLWLWALRRGERWPLLAPLAFVAGLAVLLTAVAIGDPGPGATELVGRLALGDLRRALAAATAPDVVALGRGLLEDAGVLALLVGLVGLPPVFTRTPATAALLLFCGWAALVAGAAGARQGTVGDPDAARAVLGLLMAVPVATGLAHLGAKMGQARWYAALALAVIVAVAPGFDGGRARWVPSDRTPERLLDRALAGARPGWTVDPGSEPMRALFRYAQAIGLRPDLHVR